MPEGWSAEEIRATVEDYFDMLEAELTNRPFNKSEHRRTLMSRLRGRSPTAVERKHQNISAILREIGLPSIDGYKRLPNYQQALADDVQRYVRSHPEVRRLIDSVEMELPGSLAITAEDPRELFVEPPESDPVARRGRKPLRPRQGASYEFEVRDAKNRALGAAGEEFVVELERLSLEREGKSSLAKRVEWVSRQRGDGAGYDVLSFDRIGRERFIEVKTTNFGKRQPFLITRNEVDFADQNADRFFLYRLFFFSGPRRSIYALAGSVRKSCRLDCVVYEGLP